MSTIVITGASDGIGAAAARILRGGDGRLILVGRSPEKTAAVAAEVGAEHFVADYAHLDQVRALADALLAATDRIDVLANNAGGMFSGPTRTEDGFERTFQINVLAPVLLTNLLRKRLVASQAAVVNTASIAARLFGRLDLDDIQTWDAFTPNRAYGNAKLGNILFTRGLHEHLRGRGITTVAFHPGNVATSFASDTTSYLRWLYHTALRRFFLILPERGGANLAHFIQGRPGVDWISGEYYDDHYRPGRTAREGRDLEVVRQYWDRLAELLDLSW
jgi:NAD(P)-dependent dehydrogenase (short-subunit alcohol dehydrogenase family)